MESLDAMTTANGTHEALERAAHVETVRQALQTPPVFQVYGLSNPALTPSRLISIDLGDQGVDKLSLGFGDAAGSAGRFVEVISAHPSHTPPDLSELLAGEARRLGQQVTQDPPTAPELTPAGGLNLDVPIEIDGMIVVDGLAVPAHLRRQGRVWAAAVTVSPGRVVTVVSRGVDPATLELTLVHELRPYVMAWEEHELKAVAAKAFMEPQPDVPLTPSRGMNAHTALMNAWLHDSSRTKGLVVDRDSGTQEQTDLWDAAVQIQSHYAKCSTADARAAVISMVNQALWLGDQRSWEGTTRDIHAAMGEMATYTVFDSNVPSRLAQEWWGRVWALALMPPADDPEVAKERHRERVATQAVWLSAWDKWSQGDDTRQRREN